MSESDIRFMRLALSLGRRGLGRVAPWPSVGCVIVRDGRIVGRGTSDAETLRHAERVALDQAGDSARGATVYVTLEPCSHHGRTPPCADALIDAGVARVVVATGDPNPQVAGQGLTRMRDAGIAVESGVLDAEVRAHHAGFLLTVTEGRPFLTLKLASTLDGRIATASGDSQWITGPEARRAAHAMRMSHDAVLVGGGTARADNPTLTVRDIGTIRQPVRIVASRRLDLPWPSRLAETIGEGPVWLAHGQGQADPDAADRWTSAGARLVPVPTGGAHLDPRALMETLAQEGLTRVFCEGGGSLAASLLLADLVDHLVIMSAGKVVGSEGLPSVGAMGISALADARRFDLVEVRRIGADVLHRWVRA